MCTGLRRGTINKDNVPGDIWRETNIVWYYLFKGVLVPWCIFDREWCVECLPVYFLSNADAESSIKPHSSVDLDKRHAGTQNDRRGMGGRDGGL
jgi:hypothetical protein